MENEKVLVLDFGGQYNQLIARRVRECNVYYEVKPYNMPLDKIKQFNPKGIIFTGGPNSVYGEDSPLVDKGIFELGIPVLGICYGCQFTAYTLGGDVLHAPKCVYGKTIVSVDKSSLLFKHVKRETTVWMSHTDYVSKAPEGYVITGKTSKCPGAAMENREEKIYAVHFHPEVMHSEEGMTMLRAFVYDVCGCKGDWQMVDFAKTTIEAIRKKVGNGKELCALSGGACVFVDHGLLRKNEGDEVEAVFGPKGPYKLNFIRVNAQERFYAKLAGVTEPERKRKIIGEEFIRVFEDEAIKIGKVDFLVQGTIYPDVIESGLGKSATIKSHHNVDGRPSVVYFKEIIEPLRLLFKDEVSKVGLELGIPDYLVYRQPFPGPGLGIRIIGDVTAEKVKIVQEADAIYREEIAKAGVDKSCNLGQYFAALTNMRSVGVMEDGRTYDYAIALRAVQTSDFMTADWERIPYDVLDIISRRFVNEVPGINRVLLNCTSKPPATIEFE
jgi:GMP synthase (glutamine-hydrolysing)